MALTFRIPGLRLRSGDNGRGNWRARASEVKRQRRIVALVLGARRPVAFPVRVTVVRIAPRALDSDGLASSAKAVRDEVARWLGVDDGVAERAGDVEWCVRAERAGVREYAVRIEIEEVAT